MVKYLILEDEPLAQSELTYMLGQLRPDWQLAGTAQSIETGLSLLRNTPADLLFSDISLSDGLCFDLFEQQPTQLPIIFTTAYDEYALQAFQTNSVHYLLKPIDEGDLQQALQKFEQHYLPRLGTPALRQTALSYNSHLQHQRFLVRLGDRYRYITLPQIAYFYSEDKYTLLQTTDGHRYVMDYTLSQLSGMLPPQQFMLIARNCLASIGSIGQCIHQFGGRLKVQLQPPCPVEVSVSRHRAADVLRWLDGQIGTPSHPE